MNAPQIYQYPLNLFYGDPSEDMSGEPNKFTPIEINKVVERERSKIELVAGNFVHSGFNLWTP